MDVMEGLKRLEDESVDCVVTSPPYWALRDYGVEGQLGLEPTFQEYINKLCDIFDEVKRVLKKTGTCWVNLGDSYAGNMGKKSGWTDNKLGFSKEEAIEKGVCLTNKTKIIHQLPQKCLVGIPARFQIEMINRGWILRNVIIWKKNNCMPSSVKDRFTVDFEYVFFFTKNKKYYFEQQFETYAPASDVRYRQKLRAGKKYNSKEPYKNNLPYNSIKRRGNDKDGLCVGGNNQGRNKRAVWTINSKPFSEAHFAVYPEELCETPIKAGCPKEVCVKCGKPKEPIFKSNPQKREIEWHNEKYGKEDEKTKRLGRMQPQKSVYNTSQFKGYKPTCSCNVEFKKGVVLDPFVGSGTTLKVARNLNIDSIGIELNPEYIKIIKKRLFKGHQPLVNDFEVVK